MDIKRITASKKMNIGTLKLAITNEKNPIIQALVSLDDQTINHLESQIQVPEMFHNFFEELKFGVAVYRAERLPANLNTIEYLNDVADSLLKSNELTKAFKIINLNERFINHKSISVQDKINSFLKISAILFIEDKKKFGVEALKKALELVQDLPSFELQANNLQIIAKNFFILGNEKEVIKIINTLTQTPSFSYENKTSAFLEIFNFMNSYDDPDLMFSILEGSQNSPEKNSALKSLVSWILEDSEHEDRSSQALQVAKLIQDEQIRVEAMSLIPKDKEPADEIEY